MRASRPPGRRSPLVTIVAILAALVLLGAVAVSAVNGTFF